MHTNTLNIFLSLSQISETIRNATVYYTSYKIWGQGNCLTDELRIIGLESSVPLRVFEMYRGTALLSVRLS